MPNKKGFPQGTTHIDNPDQMKGWDHIRRKNRCKHYHHNYCGKEEYCDEFKRKCTCVSHCEKYDDGIPVNAPKNEEKIDCGHINDFLNSLQYKIPIDSKEGELIKFLMLKKEGITASDIQKSKNQELHYNNIISSLRKEIDDYNERLRKECTFLFFFFRRKKYESKCRCFENEKPKYAQIVDKDLKQRVANFEKKYSEYKRKVYPETKKWNQNFYFLDGRKRFIKGHYKEAILYFEKAINNFEINSMVDIYKALKSINDKGLVEINKDCLNYLILYASYLGNSTAMEEYNQIFK